MSTLTKVFVVLNAVVSIALACLTVATAAQWDNWRELSETYKTERDAAIQKEQSTAATAQVALALKDESIAALDRDLAAARNQIESLQNETGELTSSLTQERNERRTAEASRTKLQEILDVTTAELNAIRKQQQALSSQNMQLQERNRRLNSRVLELTTNVQILTDQVRDVREKLAAAERAQQTARAGGGTGTGGGQGVQPLPGARPVEPRVGGEIQGEIVAVDGALAEINVGESAGVSPGMRFMVYSENSYLGEFEAERVRPNATAGRLTLLSQGEVRPGARVVYDGR